MKAPKKTPSAAKLKKYSRLEELKLAAKYTQMLQNGQYGELYELLHYRYKLLIKLERTKRVRSEEI